MYHVNGEWLEDVINNPKPLWGCDEALILPNAVGEFRIESPSSGEALYELGLRDGDIPVSLNGYPLGDFTEAFEAFVPFLNGETEFTLTIRRSESPFTLYYVVD